MVLEINKKLIEEKIYRVLQPQRVHCKRMPFPFLKKSPLATRSHHRVSGTNRWPTVPKLKLDKYSRADVSCCSVAPGCRYSKLYTASEPLRGRVSQMIDVAPAARAAPAAPAAGRSLNMHEEQFVLATGTD
ncbi:hypothetical protein EVAR_36782_1 [Eumeta japonica]|uniref:Uncharacterized protein n=1 Tax=Eumeta variegata TaxID=151549 RepID=A0A4C1X432_EUMVA|nr:hypothetical protein EVAR_36782_1 [Eumeta japonica]